jgi:hypothetical protein
MATTWSKIVQWWRRLRPKRCANPDCRRWILPRVIEQPDACRRECNAEVARLLRAHYAGGEEEPTPATAPPMPSLAAWDSVLAVPGRCSRLGVCDRFPWCDCRL